MKKVMVMTMMLVTFIVNSVFASPVPVSDTLDCNDIHFNVLEQVEDQGYQVRDTGFDSEQFSNDRKTVVDIYRINSVSMIFYINKSTNKIDKIYLISKGGKQEDLDLESHMFLYTLFSLGMTKDEMGNFLNNLRTSDDGGVFDGAYVAKSNRYLCGAMQVNEQDDTYIYLIRASNNGNYFE